MIRARLRRSRYLIPPDQSGALSSSRKTVAFGKGSLRKDAIRSDDRLLMSSSLLMEMTGCVTCHANAWFVTSHCKRWLCMEVHRNKFVQCAHHYGFCRHQYFSDLPLILLEERRLVGRKPRTGYSGLLDCQTTTMHGSSWPSKREKKRRGWGKEEGRRLRCGEVMAASATSQSVCVPLDLASLLHRLRFTRLRHI